MQCISIICQLEMMLQLQLLPTPEQRIYMKDRIRQIRSLTTGQGLFTFDFQNDGEFVGGCIAGGRNYFHINANGDAEPCVFIHYSGANIRTNTLLEILNQPLFMAYRKNQPFNKNHLRPCPMLENPEILQKMVKETGAKSTDLQSGQRQQSIFAANVFHMPICGSHMLIRYGVKLL